MRITKQCTICSVFKSVTQFSFKNKSLGKLHARCKECQSKLARKAYLKNKKKYLDKAKKNNPIYRARIRDYIWEVLIDSKCVDCSETDPLVLEFDHVRGKKAFEIGKKRIMSLKRLKQEIAKCEIRCSNCHKRKTAKERGYWKDKLKAT